MANNYGGKRDGAGRPVSSSTLVSQKMREVIVNKVKRELNPILDAQIRLAKGVTVMMTREKVKQKDGSYKREGRWYQVTSAVELKNLLNHEDEDNENFYQITTKDPEQKPAGYLIDQAVGKATEIVEHRGQVTFVIDE